MPATYNYQLLDYETNYEDALGTYLANTIANTQVLTPRTLLSSQPILTTPRITVAVQITGTNANQTGTRTTDGKDYDSHKIGSVSLVCVTRRDGAVQALGALRGKTRVAMLGATAALNTNNLPYYQTITLREGAATISSDADNDEIITSLNYALEFAIKPDQWANV
jgi:hypothetical protein